MTALKKCGYCRKTFKANRERRSYCDERCGAKAQEKQMNRYRKVTPTNVTRALDRFEATYGTRVPAEVPAALAAWCELLEAT